MAKKGFFNKVIDTSTPQAILKDIGGIMFVVGVFFAPLAVLMGFGAIGWGIGKVWQILKGGK